jgi:pimeloyl-ACP methyl ester carboxylesterase
MKTLVLIPAFGCDGRLYEPQIAALGGRISCVVHIAAGGRFETMVAGLLASQPQGFAVLGTSMGGRLALEATLAAPERVKGLCVMGAGAGAVADKTAGQRRSQRIRDGEKNLVLQEMAGMISHLPGARGQTAGQKFVDMGRRFSTAALLQQSEALAHRTDRWSRVAEISCPSLFLWGAEDQFSPAADGARLAKAVQNGRFVELPGCGHLPTLEVPDQATEAIVTWLEEARLI